MTAGRNYAQNSKTVDCVFRIKIQDFLYIFTESNLLIVIFDLFVSSPSSLNFLLTWITVLLAIYPDIQRNVQKEITNIVGFSRSVSLADKTQ